MAHQSLIWTALPNGLTDDGEALRVSVMLTPRLDPEADPARLGSFAPDWLDWPATLSRATVHLLYGGATVSVPVGQTAGADRVDDSLGTADRDVWKALFHAELLVRGGPFKDQSANQILSYDTTEMASLVASLYGTLAGATPGRLPTVTEALNQPGVDALVGAVQAIDRTFTDQETGLRDTRRQFEAYRKNGLVEQEGLARTLALTQLFHTPPSTPIAERHTRLDDPRIDATWREHEQTALPAPADLAKRLDFHQVLAAMNPYPTLLRRLGIVVDLAVSRAAFADAADAPLWVSVTFEPDDLAVPRGPDTSPVTHASLSPTAFAAVPNPAPGPAVMRVSDGLLDLDPKRFALLDVDVDGAGLKVMNFARSLARHARGDERVDSVTRKEKELGAPALRTAGLMLVHRERAAMLAERFGTTAAKNALAQEVADAKPGAAPPELWAEDLLRGFRFDAWDATTGRWRSLCRREATYVLGGGAVKVEAAAGEEEGTVRLAATKSPDPASNPGLLWLHEAVVSWTGWSLAAPPPGRAILPDDSVGSEAQTEAELPPGLDFRSRFRAVRRSLPRLRFGRRYWLRARAVDLAGNSLPPQENDFGAEQPAEHARPFLRYEPVAAPVIALVKRDDGTTERPAEGESMQRIAIRSFNDAPGDNAVPSTQTARRFAVPQQVSAREAELHGALDVAGRVDPATFDMLANQRDRDAHDPAAALIEEVIPTQGPLDATPADTPFAVYHDGRELTYLPDPLAREVAVRIFGHPDVDEAAIITVPLYPGADWPQAAPFKVEVLEAPGDVPAYDEGSRTLRVPLAKAERVTVRLSMRLSEHALDEIMGVWRWVAGPNPDLRALALDGQQWALTPWRTLELVHAVQRPLIDPEMQKLFVDRERGETSARPRFAARCSLKSTDRLDLRADWHEPSDDPSATESIAGAVDRHRGDKAFSVKITSPDDYAQRHAGFPRGGIPDHLVIAPDLIDVNLEVGHDLQAPKQHEFHDTRYRRIEYWLEGTTRFREYLPAGLLTEEVAGTPVPTEEHVKVVGPRAVTWIPSSAPPPAPEMLYVLPTFGWVRSRTEGGDASSWRRGGGLRVYLNGPWNASGYGEMLGVVLAPAAFTGDPESEPRAHPYKKLVTQWGNDPIWSSAFVHGLAPPRSSFPLARNAPDPAGAWLPDGAPATEAEQPPGPFRVTGLGSYDAPLEVAPHDVFYDAERRLWYCDIEIDQGASYWPFVRLALARYQPASVYGAELSEVVLADFMPLAADRWLTVTQGQDQRTRRVSVFGSSYRDSSGRLEASRAPSMSLIDPITGTTRALQPTDVAGTSVIEVWIERLDPARGEDFGWERVPAGGMAPLAEPEREAAAALPGAAGLARFVPAQEIARARELKAGRRFSDLLSEGLVENILGFLTLWDGTVTLPADPSADARLRLVIAEYEEYLVDDDNPYDRVPTRKGRRLVFVEHVELT